MTRENALYLLSAYCDTLKDGFAADDPVLTDAAGMKDRFPADGDVDKAMRWLGYMQGVLVHAGVYTLEEVKEHSRARMLPPDPLPDDAREAMAEVRSSGTIFSNEKTSMKQLKMPWGGPRLVAPEENNRGGLMACLKDAGDPDRRCLRELGHEGLCADHRGFLSSC